MPAKVYVAKDKHSGTVSAPFAFVLYQKKKQRLHILFRQFFILRMLFLYDGKVLCMSPLITVYQTTFSVKIECAYILAYI